MSDSIRLELLLATFAGWVHRQQTEVIDYLREENRVLKAQLGSKRLRLTDDQRRRPGVRPVITSYLAPNMNSFAERFVLSIQSECLDRMIFVGEETLLRALDHFCTHYHRERPHQGIGNEIINRGTAGSAGSAVEVRERLGGLLKYYHRSAA